MGVLEVVAIRCSPYPVVDLEEPKPPLSGLVISRPNICNEQFAKGKCLDFYRTLSPSNKPVQCPYGFSTWPIQVGDKRIAITSIICKPGLGGETEDRRIKEYPRNRVDVVRLQEWIESIQELIENGNKARHDEFTRRLEALHEIRRFNQIIKTNLERVCERESPTDLDAATVEIVRALRAAGLISTQLDALDLLANPTSAMTFKSTRKIFYRVVDKMIRIYQIRAKDKNVSLRLTGYSVAEAMLDDRTIHIIPSVFIDNAIKYSLPGEAVEVHVKDEVVTSGVYIQISVRSNGPFSTAAEESKLLVERRRGTLASKMAQGSGLGLYLANIVANQHSGRISYNQRRISNDRSEWTFSFRVGRANRV